MAVVFYMRRIAFYLFYDKDGIVDEYIYFKLTELKKHVDEIFFVSNSKIKSEYRKRLETVVDTIYCRENIGFDVWAYKEAMEVYGSEKLNKFDEIILLNYTFYGPIFPFNEMFEWAESKSIDFWGISDHKEMIPNPFTGDGVLPRHIQSHFIAVRKSVFSSIEFKNYWEKMPMITSYTDSVLNHESKFTKYFHDKGFDFDVYVNSEEYGSDYPVFIEVDKTIENRSPILKRRVFFHDPIWLDVNSVELKKAIDLVKTKSNYDTRLIWSNINRSAEPRHLLTNAEQIRIFDENSNEEVINKEAKIAVIAHVYYPDMISEILDCVDKIPVKFDLYISTVGEKSKSIIVDYIEKNSTLNNVKVRLVPKNRGRDISSLFILFRDICLSDKYDYICRLHSKKSPQNGVTQANGFKYHMYNNLLCSKGYVAKILNYFEHNQNVGLLIPPMVHIGYPTMGHSWFSNYEKTKKIAKKLGVNIVFDKNTPHAAYGTMYWFRPKSLYKLFSFEWQWEDFNEEPNHVDGGLAHVMERLIAYCALDAGYIVNYISTIESMQRNYVKLEYKHQEIMSYMSNDDVMYQRHLLSIIKNEYCDLWGVINAARSYGDELQHIKSSRMWRYSEFLRRAGSMIKRKIKLVKR